MSRALWRAGLLALVVLLGSAIPAFGVGRSTEKWTHRYGSKVITLEKDVLAFHHLPKQSTSQQDAVSCQHIGSASQLDRRVTAIPNKKAEASWLNGLKYLTLGAQACEKLEAGETLLVNSVGPAFTKGTNSLVALSKMLSLKVPSEKASATKGPGKPKPKPNVSESPNPPSSSIPSKKPTGLGGPIAPSSPNSGGQSVSPGSPNSPNGTSAPAQTGAPPSKGSNGEITFGDGTWAVGTGSDEVTAGTYRTSGGSGCMWARQSTSHAMLAGSTTSGQVIVTILPTDGFFEASSCGTWSPLPSTGSEATTFGDGIYAVGIDIAPGTYTTSGGNDCFWERVSDFTGSGDDVIASGLHPGSDTVTIAASDKGFVTQGCGTWSTGS